MPDDSEDLWYAIKAILTIPVTIIVYEFIVYPAMVSVFPAVATQSPGGGGLTPDNLAQLGLMATVFIVVFGTAAIREPRVWYSITRKLIFGPGPDNSDDDDSE